MTQPDLAPAPKPDPVTAFLSADRKRAGLLILVFAVLWAAPAAYATARVVRGWGAAAKAPADKPGDAVAAEEAAKALPDPNWVHYFVVAVAAGLGALVAASGGLWLVAALPPLTAAAGLTQVRSVLLVVGGLGGFLLMLVGVWFFLNQLEMLNDWVTRGETKNAWRVLTALLVFVAGAGLSFLAVQPARAEERNNQGVRRLVYGANLFLTVALVAMILVMGNVVAAVKVPNKLDTTATGFYSLDKSTVAFVKGLTTKVTVHAVIPTRDRPFEETISLLDACREANPDKFFVKSYGENPPLADRQRLKAKFPQADMEDLGLVVALGDDETRYAYIRADELTKQEGGGRGSREEPKLFFVGEGRIMRELVFLAENKSKPVVYVTQGSGELSITPGEPAPDRDMTAVKAYLEKNNVDVRPLAFDPKSPAKIPDDATMIIVPDPKFGLPADAVAAIKAYVTTPKADGKKGKLVVISGPHATPGKAGVAPTGLEETLAELNVMLVPAYIYGELDRRQQLPPDYAVVTPAAKAVAAKNPIALSLAEIAFVLPLCKPVEPIPGNPAYKADALLETQPGRTTWYESAEAAEPDKVFQEIRRQLDAGNTQVIQKKRLSRAGRPVGVTVSEGPTTRAVVIGCGVFFSDTVARQVARGDANPPGQLLLASIDWLRDRPPVPDSVNKSYEFYAIRPDADGFRLKYLPLGLAAVIVSVLGVGVWVVRRK